MPVAACHRWMIASPAMTTRPAPPFDVPSTVELSLGVVPRMFVIAFATASCCCCFTSPEAPLDKPKQHLYCRFSLYVD